MNDDALISSLQTSLQTELQDTSAMEQRVRRRIAAERVRRKAGIALGVAVVLGFSTWRMLQPDPVFAAAARDHQREVVEHQPRRWKTGTDMPLPAFGLTTEIANRFSAQGYQLEQAKTCGLEGQRSLHLVYSNGTTEFSMYLRPGSTEGFHNQHIGQEQVTAFPAGRYQAMLVTTGSGEECEKLARSAAAFWN